MSTKKHLLVLDTDPGVDDAVALLILLGHPEVDMKAVTVVGGNVGLNSTLRNALCLVELAGRTDIPVYAGAAQPMVDSLTTAEDVHGRMGLGPLVLPDPAKQPTEGDVSEVFYRLAKEHPGELTILAIGPLTNLGKAFLAHPDLPGLLKEVVIMGGSIVGGNATLQAEFNIYVDPEAARIVFRSGVKLTMIPLDVCKKTALQQDAIARIAAVGNRAADAAHQLLQHAYKLSTERFGLVGAPMYDAVAAAVLLKPELYEIRDFNVEIELHGARTRGRTVVDYYGFTKKPANCAIPLSGDVGGYVELVCECLENLP